MDIAPEERFTSRVSDYARYRPSYPAEIIHLLRRVCGLTSMSSIVDIAAGTGILTRLFLDNGNRVIAIEPNAAMLQACRNESASDRLRCLQATAEKTGLEDASCDFVTVGQAMHWFDLEAVRAEFTRILRADGWCAVIYNERRRGHDLFHEGYEKLLRRFGRDYAEVQRKHLSSESLQSFFAPCVMRREELRNCQSLDLAAFLGRLTSSSYMPLHSDDDYAPMVQAATELFSAFEEQGKVILEYVCSISFAKLRCS